MYAIVKCGGKQLKVQKGDTVRVERVASEVGDKIVLDEVLMIADGDKLTIGSPLVKGATVTASIAEQIRDKKIIVFKKKRRQNYRRKNGHRQYITMITIDAISASGAKEAPKKAAAKAKAPEEKATKPAAKKAASK